MNAPHQELQVPRTSEGDGSGAAHSSEEGRVDGAEFGAALFHVHGQIIVDIGCRYACVCTSASAMTAREGAAGG